MFKMIHKVTDNEDAVYQVRISKAYPGGSFDPMDRGLDSQNFQKTRIGPWGFQMKGHVSRMPSMWYISAESW